MTKLVVEKPADLFNLVGKTLGPTEGMVITQERINQFADATGDHQWIHVDEEKAASGPFGATGSRLSHPLARREVHARADRGA